MNCEMQLNFVVNVHVAVHISTFQRNKKCISLSEHPVCVLYTVDIHTQKDTHGPIVSAAHTAVTVHIRKIATDILHTALDNLRRSHKQFQCNKKCTSLSEHPVYQRYIVDIYTQKDTHGPIISAAHSADTLHIPHIPTDTLHTELDTLRRSHKQF